MTRWGALLVALTGGCNALVGIPGSEADGVDAGSLVLPLRLPEGGLDRKDTGVDAPLPATAAVMVSSGFGFGSWCAVTVEGNVMCWGDNFYGDLGDGTTTSSATPVMVQGLPGKASFVSVGPGTACAIVAAPDGGAGGAVWCWGDGEVGELGNGSSTQIQKSPVPVTHLQSDVIALSVGYFSACAVTSDGTVWCWGTLGEGDSVGATSSSVTPVPVQGISSATDVSVGLDTVCAISAGAVLCWGGYGGPDMLGNGTSGGSMTPVPVTNLTSGVTSISVGGAFACAVDENRAVECWGYGGQGQLGQGTSSLITSPVPVVVMSLPGPATAVAAGVESVCALGADGSVSCWGVADDGELGNGIAPDLEQQGPMGYLSGIPVKVAGLTGKATFLSRGMAPCVVTEGGGVECWGLTCDHETIPVEVSLPVGTAMTPVTAVSVSIGGDESNGFACAVASQTSQQSQIACWGSNDYGELGDGQTQRTTRPVALSTAPLEMSATAVSTSPDGPPFACGLGSVGGGNLQAQCWGYDGSGQLGLGTSQMASADMPLDVALPSGVEVTAVSAGGISACALTTEGAVYCWGDNTYGEIGSGVVGGTATLSPLAVSTLSSGVAAISVGLDYACALLTGGTVDCWGDNSLGQLGTGSSATTSTPTPVPGLTDVASISAGWFSTCAVTRAGSLYCWGYGEDCELGNGTQSIACTSNPTPALVSTKGGALEDVTKVSVGYTSACAIAAGGAYCWGADAIGNSEFSSFYTAPYAVPVTNLTTGVTDIAAGHTSACAIAEGVLWCWGSNTGGQLGNGGAVNEIQATAVMGFP